MRARVFLAALAAVALVAGVAWWFLRESRTTYEQALDTLPAGTLRATYTDWGLARSKVRSSDLSDFIEKAYVADLTRMSALENTAVVLDDLYGLSLRSSEWEAYGQSDDGSVAVLRVADSTSYSRLRATLRKLGYGEPSSDTGAWTGTADLIAGLDPSLTPVLENALLLEDEHLVLFSDNASYAERAARVATGGAESVLSAVGDLPSRVGDPASAVLWASDHACQALSMASADPSDVQVAEGLVAKAGGVNPLTGLLMASARSGEVTVAMSFETDDQASKNLQPRTDLASGDAPGLGGSFLDRFKVTSGKAEGHDVVLRLKAAPDEDALLSSISDGPVLFATC